MRQSQILPKGAQWKETMDTRCNIRNSDSLERKWIFTTRIWVAQGVVEPPS